MKMIHTKSGDRWIERLEPTDRLWTLWKDLANKPVFLTGGEFGGRMTFTVWGRSQFELESNLRDLKRRLAAVNPNPQDPAAVRPERPRGKHGDAFECARCISQHRVCDQCLGRYDDEDE